MEIENVRAAAQKVDWAAGELYMKPHKLKGIASSLKSAWEGGQAAQYAAELRKLAKILQHEVITLQRLAQRARTEVNEWEAADNIPGTNSIALRVASAASNLRTVVGAGAGLILASGITVGTTYAGQAIVPGSHTLKNLAGVSSHLTHLKAANIAQHLKAQPLGPLEIGLAGFEFGGMAINDLAKYERGSEKAAAVALDALFVAGKTVATHYAAGAIAGLVVGAIAGAPVAVVAGVGILTWIGTSYIVGKVMGAGFDHVKDAAVQTVSQGIDAAVNSVKTALNYTAKASDRFFDSIRSRISSPEFASG